MSLDTLATELLLHIFRSCTSIPDVLNLSLTSRRLHSIFSGTQKLPILAAAAESEYGPIHDIIQLVTQNASQPAHTTRSAPMSMALLRQIVAVGRVARQWEDIYPAKKWKVDFENRRVLNADERYRLRRAVYRLWLYGRAFHTPLYPRGSRRMRDVVLERAELLHNWSSVELAEIEDVRRVIADVVTNQICPSNGTIQRKFRKRFLDGSSSGGSGSGLAFNIHLNYPPPPSVTSSAFAIASSSSHGSGSGSGAWDEIETPISNPFFTLSRPNNNSTTTIPHRNKYATIFRTADTSSSCAGSQGWGDEIPHYYIVQDMLKLDPGQILWLRDTAVWKEDVLAYTRGMGEWFENNGETWAETVEWVLAERGVDAGGWMAGVEAGGDEEEGGVARRVVVVE